MTADSDTNGLVKCIQAHQMEKDMAEAKSQDMQYEEAVIEYLRDSGQIICISDDLSFTEMLRSAVCSRLKMPASSLHISTDADRLLQTVRTFTSTKNTPLLLIEQSIKTRDLTYMLRQLKTGFPELWIIVITRETNKHRFILMHESGVDNCIIKPIGVQGLIEKLAFTIKPYGKLGRVLEWARTLMAQGENLRALQVCKQALDLKANSAAALLIIGDIFRGMKQWDKACEAYETASRSSDMYLEPLRKLTEVYEEMGNSAKRLEYLERLDALSPLNVERKLTMGEIYLQLGKNDDAKKSFTQAVILSDREASEYVSGVAYRVADVYMDKDPETAAEFLKRGLDAKKEFWGVDDLRTFNRIGILLRRVGKWAEAVEEYKKALKVAPNDESLHYNLGMALAEGQDFEGARKSMLKALALNPELPRRSAPIAANIAMVFNKTGDNMHALPLLRTALELEPENAQAKELEALIKNA